MTISKSNFEAFMLDYLEGNLDPLLSAELMAFLAENPELDLLSDYKEESLAPESQFFQGKNILKKKYADVVSITPENFDEFCVAFTEEWLDKNDKARLMDYITSHPEYQHELDCYKRAKLHDEHPVEYPEKEKLKKSVALPFRVRSLVYVLGVAASIAFIVLLATRNKDVPETSGFPSPGPAAPVVAGQLSQTNTAVTPPVSPANMLRPVVSSSRGEKTPETSGYASEFINRDLQVPDPLRPIYAHNLDQVEQPVPERILPAKESIMATVQHTAQAREPESSTAFFLGTVLRKLNVWKAAESAVSGFNYLTESQLSITRQTDRTGKLTGIALDMEEYRISGNKIK